MIAKLRLNHPFVLAVITYAVFFAVLVVSGEGIHAIAVATGIRSAFTDCMESLISELLAALVPCFVLYKVGTLKLLKKRGRGFWAGLAVGGYCLGYIAFLFFRAMLGENGEFNTAFNVTAASFVSILAMLAVGFAEEALARGVIAQTFLERYGLSRKGIMKAAVISGVMFGLMHLVNLMNDEPYGVTTQVILCITSGVLYGAIYFRSGNIWAIAFIHGLNDVAADMGSWLYAGGAGAAASNVGFSIEGLVLVLILGAVELSVAYFLLRESRISQVRESWPELQGEPQQ